MYCKFDIILIDLNPVKGSEQSGIRPCMIIQTDFANKYAKTFVVAIISSTLKDYPHIFITDASKTNGLIKKSKIDFLQVRTIDESRIIKKLGNLEKTQYEKCNEKIRTAFHI